MPDSRKAEIGKEETWEEILRRLAEIERKVSEQMPVWRREVEEELKRERAKEYHNG